MAEKELKQLKEITKELEEIKDRTANPRRSFVNGILYGAGGLLGGLLAIALIGWLLSILGVIPGLERLVPYIQGLLSEIPSDRGYGAA